MSISRWALLTIAVFLVFGVIGYCLPGIPMVGQASDICSPDLLVYRTSGKICGYVIAYRDGKNILLFPGEHCRCFAIPKNGMIWRANVHSRH